MKNPAWSKLTPLERKLEMRRRARVRKANRIQRLREGAVEGVTHRPGAALVRVAG